MTREAYAVLFSRVGWFVVLFALSVHVITQGGAAEVNLPGLDTRMANISAYFAIPIIGFSLAITCVAGALHAMAPRPPHEPALPLAGLGEAAASVDARTLSSKLYIAMIFVIIILLPAFTLGHLTRTMPQRAVIWNEEQDPALAVQAACMMPIPWSLSCRPEEQSRLLTLRGEPGERLSLADNACDPKHFSQVAVETCTPSLACAETPKRCRGVDWLPAISPIVVILPAMAGLFGVAFLVFSLARAPLERREAIP